ncbi:DUF4235 domain-containing protein [Streptomyces olivaceiscleroticus]|uniref:DUF4235 domain-containing protein n=1 Tax=Streptomyces olivaceiscleroticus TaxID=68245 RepID=A0ABN1B7K8_9ACTN
MNAAKVVYTPVGVALGACSGIIAGALFKQTWKRLGHEGDTPSARDEERTWKEVLLAAALQGAIFATVKAAMDRSGATAIRRLTGTWPG